MPPADFDLRNGSTFQPNLACQILLAEAASPRAAREARSALDPCLLICHSAIIALSLVHCYTGRTTACAWLNRARRSATSDTVRPHRDHRQRSPQASWQVSLTP